MYNLDMPLLSLMTSAAVPNAARRAEIFTRLTALLARELDKPEGYVMVALNPGAQLSFGGDAATPCCYAELKNVGQLGAERVAALSQLLCAELEGLLRVSQARIYIEFTNSDGAFWGWNGETFS
jgi:phenylpyruvate tautomerase